MSYKSTAIDKEANYYLTEVLKVLGDLGIQATLKKDMVGYYGLYFVFPGLEIHALSIQDRKPTRFERKNPPRLSLHYQTVYRFMDGNRPLCYGLTVDRSFPSVSTTVKNLKGRYVKIKTSYEIQVQEDGRQKAFNSETKDLEREFPRFKINIEGNLSTGHSIQFDGLPLERARQILQVLTDHLPDRYEVGEGK